MALSQVQCLDDHHVNWRVSENKPEFFYSEDQRRALEALVTGGRDALADYLQENGVREFLSEPELERIEHRAEAYRPGHEHHQRPETPGPGNVTPASWDDGEISLQYWPDRSEASVAELDLGWPESISYRGVTRVTVHTQPPTGGYTHIKEVVRKSIAAALKVIAVVMDVFTDVDIFRDLMDAGFKRNIPVYIIIDMAAVPSFLSMCGRADMHRGHLKNLRVRCCGGVEFFTRSAEKVRGSLSQKYIFIDGDRAISGSYSFTWSSSRLDRNLITVITGQAVETFDLQFQDLYLLSRGVSLSKVPMEDEPIREPLPQAVPVQLSATAARRLINPKYALVSSGTQISTTSSDQNSSNKNSNILAGLKIMKRVRHVHVDPPLHPGLAHLEKAYMIPYLPTWPEPDPPKDVIGFINIRDDKRAHQVHLQRSERFAVSQAVRFSSPLKEQTNKPAPGEKTNVTVEAESPFGNTSRDTSTPVSPTNKQLKEKTRTVHNTDQTDSKPPSQKVSPPSTQDTNKQTVPTPASPSKVTEDSQPTDNPEENQETSQTAAPPVPKRRTLQLVIDSNTSEEQPGQPQVTLMKMDQPEDLDEYRTPQGDLTPSRVRLRLKNDSIDSCSNDEGSLDSTKVICDRGVNEDPSSNSTVSEEEYYDCQPETRDSLTNGPSSGSGHGHRQGDGVNMMARLSQSMLDLRTPSQTDFDSRALLHQSQYLRRQVHGSPHRNIGQLFQSSRSPGRDMRLRANKVVLAKPGSYHRPERAAAPVIGGYRYWQDQRLLQPGSSQGRVETRSGRSPRRHSPGYRKTDHSSPQPQPQPPAHSSGLLGVSYSKLNNLRQLRARGGASQKKPPQNKAAR